MGQHQVESLGRLTVQNGRRRRGNAHLVADRFSPGARPGGTVRASSLHACSLYDMRKETPVVFRAEPDLVDALDRAADLEGVSRSAMIRAALAEVLDLAEPSAA